MSLHRACCCGPCSLDSVTIEVSGVTICTGCFRYDAKPGRLIASIDGTYTLPWRSATSGGCGFYLDIVAGVWRRYNFDSFCADEGVSYDTDLAVRLSVGVVRSGGAWQWNFLASITLLDFSGSSIDKLFETTGTVPLADTISNNIAIACTRNPDNTPSSRSGYGGTATLVL